MHFNLYQDEGKKWRWNFCVVDEKVMAVSAMSYGDRMEAIASISLMKGMALAAKVYDKGEKRWIN